MARRAPPLATGGGILKRPTPEDVMAVQDFWDWIEGSEAVDPDGRPLLVFHGACDASRIYGLPPMTHFGTAGAARDRLLQFSGRLPWGWDEAYRSALARPDVSAHLDRLRFESGREGEGGHAYHVYPDGAFLLPAYLRILRPASVYDDGQPHDPRIVAAHLGRSWRFYEEAAEAMPECDLDREIDRLRRARSWRPLLSFLRGLGYDGLRYENVVEDRGSTSWVVFDRSQVWPAFAAAPLAPSAARGRRREPGTGVRGLR